MKDHRRDTALADETPLDDVYAMPGHLLRRMQQIAVSAFHEAVLPGGLEVTPVQYALLKAVAAYPGQDQATLAGAIAYDRTTIGGVIDRLEQKGLLRRQVSETDRRARTIDLTEDGRKALSLLDPLVASAQAEMLSGLSEAESRTLTALLTKAISAANEGARVPLRKPAPLRTVRTPRAS